MFASDNIIQEYRYMKMRITMDEILYYFFFGLMFMTKGIGMDSGQKLFQLCMLLSLMCFVFKIFFTKYNIKEWIVISFLILLGNIIWKSSGEIAAIWAMLIIVGMKNVPLERLMKLCTGLWGGTFFLSFVMGILHIKDGVVVVHEKLGLGPIIRWSLGYTHPNVLHISYFILVILLTYTFKWRAKALWKASISLMLGNLLIFLYSVSYTGVLIVTGYICLVLYFDCRKIFHNFESIIWCAVSVFLIIFPVFGPLWLNVHNHKLFMFFNELLSYRFELVWNIFAEYPVSLFGTETIFKGNAHLTLDSSFAYLLMYYGIVGFVLFSAACIYMVYFFSKNNKKYELAITLVMILGGVTEQFLFNLSFKNLLFIFMGDVLFTHLLKNPNKKNIWNNEFSIFSIQKEVNLKKIDLWKIINVELNVNIRKIFIVGILTAFIGMGIGFWAIKPLQNVYVYRWLTDYRGENTVYLDIDELPDSLNTLVIGYNGSDGEMFKFSGNIVAIEKMRSVVGGAVLGAGVGGSLMTVFYVLERRKRR